MSILIESLKRLFSNNQITIEKLDSLLSEGKINQIQYDEITN